MTTINDKAHSSTLPDIDDLCAAAAARVGYGEFGDNWREGLEQLVGSVNSMGLPAASCEGIATQIGAFLDARLHAQRGFAEHPGYKDVAIRRPMIIAGLVRSGTTVLHKLLSIDPQFQAPEHWLIMAPMPRPARSTWPSNPIYRRLAGILDSQMEISPELIEHHGQAVDEADETLLLQCQTFCANMFPSAFGVSDYDRWFRSVDERPYLRYVADVLRLIGLNEPERRWLTKNPTDLFSLDAVLDVFPDAMIVQTHRDPVQSIPSVAGTIRSVRRLFLEGEPDCAEIGQREAEFWAEALRRAQQTRERTGVDAIDIEFRDFMADQLGVVRQIYQHFDLTLSPETEQAMQRWLDAHPRRSTSLQRVAPEEFGLTAGGLAQKFGEYRALRGYG
ncbi:MAG TPA: sulfotransferase [Novosphingobium sp.]